MRANSLFHRVTGRGVHPLHVAEVGVYLPEASHVYDWIVAGVRATLVEADPVTVAKLNAHFAGRTNVTVHAAAACDFHGEIALTRAGASTYLTGLASPAVINDGFREAGRESFRAPAVLFREIDPGDIDLLSIDIEGAEWFVLKHLVSRPAVLSLETHGGRYVNPHLAQIEEWCAANGYTPWYKDRTDTVYVRKTGPLRVTAPDRLALAWRRAAIALRRWRKRLSPPASRQQCAVV